MSNDIEREAFERIDRQFASGNNVTVERASVRFEDWEAAKRYMQAAPSRPSRRRVNREIQKGSHQSSRSRLHNRHRTYAVR